MEREHTEDIRENVAFYMLPHGRYGARRITLAGTAPLFSAGLLISSFHMFIYNPVKELFCHITAIPNSSFLYYNLNDTEVFVVDTDCITRGTITRHWFHISGFTAWFSCQPSTQNVLVSCTIIF